MILERITFTGVDEKTHIGRAKAIAKASRHRVEYGILASKSAAGKKPRYPTVRQVNDTANSLMDSPNLKVAVHVCGGWSRQLLKGDAEFFEEIHAVNYRRLQWNINAGQVPQSKWDLEAAVAAMKKHFHGMTQLIIQRNNDMSVTLAEELGLLGIDMAVLFDASGGRGVVADQWEQPDGPYCGYAGGLSPENVAINLQNLADFLPEDQSIWIDMESGVRTNDWFDLGKVEAVLKAIPPEIV